MREFNKTLQQILENVAEQIPAEYAEYIKICEERVKRSRLFLYVNAPYINAIFSKLNIVYTTDGIDTMAVDNFGNIYINPKFGAKELTAREFLGVIVHETFHILNETFARKHDRHMKLWNICTDYVMNRDILDDGFDLPKMGCLPDADGNVVIDTPQQQYKFNIKNPNKSAEWLYNQIIKVLPPPPPSKGQGQGQPGDQVTNDTLDKHIDTKDGQGQPKEIPGTPKPSQDSKIKDRIEKGKQDAYNDAIKRKMDRSRGTGGGALSDVIISDMKPGLDWKALLRTLVRKVAADTTWKQPHKRHITYGTYLPRTHTVEELRKICIAIDTSGSIGDKQLSAYVAEMQALCRQFKRIKFTIVLWHTVPYYHVEITHSNASEMLKLLKGNWQSGGTDLTGLWQYITKNKIDKDLYGIIIFTDGFVGTIPTNIPTKIPVFMLIDDSYGYNAVKGGGLPSNWKVEKIKIDDL